MLDFDGKRLVIEISGMRDPLTKLIKAAPAAGKWTGSKWTCEPVARILEHFKDTPRTEAAAELYAKLDALAMYADAPADKPKRGKLYKTKPYKHQIDANNKARGKKGFGYFGEQGTGKTKMIIDEATVLFAQGDITAVFVTAWPNGVHKNWAKNELPAHLPDWIERDVCVWDAQKSKGKRWRAEHLDPVMLADGRLKFFLINSEGLAHDRMVDACVDFVDAHGGQVLFVGDECTAFKTYKSKRSKGARKVARRCKIRRIATGTPVPKSPLDYYGQFSLVDENLLGWESFSSFRSRYAVMEPVWGKTDRWGRQIMTVSGYTNLEHLQETVDPYLFRVLKDDCLDLPPKIYRRRYVELTPAQSKVYEQLTADFYAELNGEGPCPVCDGAGSVKAIVGSSRFDCTACDGTGQSALGRMTAPLAMTRIMRLHQVCMNFLTPDEDKTPQAIEPGIHPRLRLLLELRSLVNGKAITWGSYRYSLREILEAFNDGQSIEKGPAVGYWGETDEAARELALDRFLNDNTCTDLVAHPRAAGFGHTFTVANNVFYYSNDFSLELRLQSEDRPHRIGQTKPVTYTDIECEGTVDSKIIDTLRGNFDMAAFMNKDKLREWI